MGAGPTPGCGEAGGRSGGGGDPGDLGPGRGRTAALVLACLELWVSGPKHS